MPFPRSLHNTIATGVLEIVWDDDTTQRLNNAELRNHCRCAECKSFLRAGGVLNADRGTVITDIKPVGSYAAQFIFSDGHSRGIFPWTYLKELRP